MSDIANKVVENPIKIDLLNFNINENDWQSSWVSERSKS